MALTSSAWRALAALALACGSAFDCGGGGSNGGAGQDGGGDDASRGVDGGGGDSASGLEGAIASEGGPADAGGSDASSPSRPPDAYNLGLNLPSLNYYNNVAIYADMALAISGNYGPWDVTGGSTAAPLDTTGAPTVAATTGVTGDYPSGAYAVTWDGTGSITAPQGGLGAVTKTTSGGVQHNSATLTVTQKLSTPTSASWLQLAATPPVTSVHVMAPATVAAGGSMFVDDFKKAMHPFTTLRFMDALNTNGNLVENWSDRTWPSAGSRAGRAGGIAYEDVIAMANELGVDVWINVPVLATDDYVCRLARLFAYGEQGDMSNGACDPAAPKGTAMTTPLGAGSKVYVEFSNEVWNWGFQQIEDIYCMTWGMPDKTGNGKHCDVSAPTSAIAAAALADTSLPWTNSNTYEKATQMTLILVKRVSDIFRKVFACSSGKNCRAQIPMNVQAAYAAEVDAGFAFIQAAYGSLASIDAMAVAPYFNIDDDSTATSVDAVFAGLDANLVSDPDASSGGAIANWLAGDLAEAGKYGLPLVAYEGGQGLSGIDTTILVASESDPRMYSAYLTYFALWDALVGRGHLFNHYSYAWGAGSYGAWGALTNQDDPGSQKWDAMMSLTRYPGDANLDGVVDAGDCAILKASYGTSPASGLWWEQGDFNHDGVVDAKDVALMNAHISGAPCLP